MKLFNAIKNFILKLFRRRKQVFYIGGAEVLPKAYTAEEEKQKLKELFDGNESVRGELIEHNLRLVVYIARKFDNTGVDLDDLISVGTIGLIKAVNTYQADKNIKLATYASRCVENEILMHLRKVNKLKGEVSFDEPLNVDTEGNELLLSDILGTDPEVVYNTLENGAERQLLKEAIDKLNFREKKIMSLRFGLTAKRNSLKKKLPTFSEYRSLIYRA